MEDVWLYEMIDRIMLERVKSFDFKNVEIMKLLMCLECGDIFNLTMENKHCGCGKTSGRYVDDLNAEILGNCQPIGFANGSFRDAIKAQRIKNKQLIAKNECCKGVEFIAFFIPDAATSICKIEP